MNTQSLCPECYKTIDATVYTEEGKVRLKKTCDLHGDFNSIIENNTAFYKALKEEQESMFYDQLQLGSRYASVLMVEVTDRCNLTCDHCYHIPTKDEDISIESLVNKISSLPTFNMVYDIMLCGAEPTVRKDLPELITEVKKLGKGVHILTNGVQLHKEEYVKELQKVGVDSVEVGLNHEEYINKKVHNKQLKGLENLNKYGIPLEYISYTLGDIEQLEDILDEVEKLIGLSNMFRIRTPSKIGKEHDAESIFLSDLLSKVNEIALSKGKDFRILSGDNNIYHCMIQYGDAIIRLIHWCDVHTIDYKELQSGPWAVFTDNTFSNFLHQIIIRDGVKKHRKFNGQMVELVYTRDLKSLDYNGHEGSNPSLPTNNNKGVSYV